MYIQRVDQLNSLHYLDTFSDPRSRTSTRMLVLSVCHVYGGLISKIKSEKKL